MSKDVHELSHNIRVYLAFETAEKKNVMGGTTIKINSGNGEVVLMLPSYEALKLITLCKEHYHKILQNQGLNITPSVSPTKKARR